MKVVLLLAGVGSRLNKMTINNHKALIKLDDYSLLYHLIENILYAGLENILPIVGHCSEKIITCLNGEFSKPIIVNSIYNQYYRTRNNLYSLYCAREQLEGEEFILCNGDIVFDRDILVKLIKMEDLSAITIDDNIYSEPMDSPGIKINDGRIIDLGRHIPFSENEGYAIGIYKFNKILSRAFFDTAEDLLNRNMDAGFHDPLIDLFKHHPIYKCSINACLWTDIDDQSDIEKARAINNRVMSQYVG